MLVYQRVVGTPIPNKPWMIPEIPGSSQHSAGESYPADIDLTKFIGLREKSSGNNGYH